MPEPQAYEQVKGRGAKAMVEGRSVLVGNLTLLREAAVIVAAAADLRGETPVHVAVNDELVGVIFIADTSRPGAREALAGLKASGVKRSSCSRAITWQPRTLS